MDIFDEITTKKPDAFDAVKGDIFDEVAPPKDTFAFEKKVLDTAVQSVKDMPSTAYENVMGGLEVAHAAVAPLIEFAAQAPIGVAGLSKYVTSGADEATKTINQMNAAIAPILGREYKTEAGKSASQFIQKFFGMFEEAGEYWSKKVDDPGLKAGVHTFFLALPLLAGVLRKPAVVKYNKAMIKGEPITPALKLQVEGELARAHRDIAKEVGAKDLKELDTKMEAVMPKKDVFDEIAVEPPTAPPEPLVAPKKAEGIPVPQQKGALTTEAKKYKTAEEFVATKGGIDETTPNVYWHGSASGDLRGGVTGLHIGTKRAATEALEARIGIPADGKGWTGNREYGKTLLAGKDTLKKLDPKGYNETGFNVDVPKEDFYPAERAKYSDTSTISLTSKPNIQPFKIKGRMTNTPQTPYEDFKAGGYMAAQKKKGKAKSGYFYENVGEDAGSISATVPSGEHIEPLHTKSQLTDIWNEAHKPVPQEKGEGTLSFMGTQGAYNQVAKGIPRIKKMGQQLNDLIDVEAKWKRAGRPETGFSIKNIFSKRAVHEEFALDYARSVAKDVKFNKKDMSRIAFLAEQEKPAYRPDELRLKPTVEKTQKFFDDYKKKYSEYGVDIDFKERIINDINELISNAENPADIANLESALESAKQMSFVHIPSALWFKDFVGRDPAGAKSVLDLMVKQKRKSLNIQSLVDRKIIKPEDVNIVDIIASYGRRAGKDFAILDVVKAAEKEGLAVKGLREGFVNASHRAPILKGYKIHPLLADWIYEMTRPNIDAMNIFEKTISITKMSAFYNPLFLPMYDTVQGAMLGSFRSVKTPKYIYQGVMDSWKKTPEYWEALDNGLASKPFNNPLNSYERMTENAKHSQMGMIATRLLESVLPHKAIQNIYNASWAIAWELDKTVRQVSYRYLLDKGYKPNEAAQLAAKFHSDYASVPPKTRKFLNHIFFTPTFKITMGKLYAGMIGNAIKASGGRAISDMYRGLAGKEKLGKMTPAQKKLAGGLVATAGILYGWDMFWRSQGFEGDEWGRRYVKKVETEEGEKELVMTWSNPANMFLKYGYRTQAAFTPGAEKPWVKMLMTNKWEFHPLWRTGYELINNDNGRGDAIYSEFEPDFDKVKKSAVYATTHIVALLGLMDKDPSDVEARAQFKKEAGQILEMATRPFTFTYMRSPEDNRKVYRIRSVMKRFKQEIIGQQRKPRKGEAPPDEKYKILMKELQAID